MDLDEQYDKIYRYCYFKLGHRETAEDVTQETFLRFYHSYGNSLGKDKTLQVMYTFARNLCTDEFRKKKYELLDEEKIEQLRSLHISQGFENEVIQNVILHDEIEKLTEEDRELILLRYVNEVPIHVLTKIYGISRFAIYRKCNAILSQIKKGLEK